MISVTILLQLALLHWNAYSPHLDMCGPSSAMAWVTLGPDKAEKLVKAYRYLHLDNDEPDW